MFGSYLVKTVDSVDWQRKVCCFGDRNCEVMTVTVFSYSTYFNVANHWMWEQCGIDYYCVNKTDVGDSKTQKKTGKQNVCKI